jgi:8-oxo-dGTP pyrophosphatase MutT (NUDIX family)
MSSTSGSLYTPANTMFGGVGVGIAIYHVTTHGPAEFLMMLRGPEARNDQGCWDLPGGGVEGLESLEDTVRREAFEELGVTLGAVELLGPIWHTAPGIAPAPHQRWLSYTHLAKLAANSPLPCVPADELGKCERLDWLTLSETNNRPLASSMAANIELIRTLRPERPKKRLWTARLTGR